MHVSDLRPVEPVYLDSERLEAICHELGYRGAEEAISQAMEEIAVLLQQSGKLWRTGQAGALEEIAFQVQVSAESIGMTALSRVAGDVMRLAKRDDAAALAATVARMRRLGEDSLLAIWDRQDLTV